MEMKTQRLIRFGPWGGTLGLSSLCFWRVASGMPIAYQRLVIVMMEHMVGIQNGHAFEMSVRRTY